MHEKRRWLPTLGSGSDWLGLLGLFLVVGGVQRAVAVGGGLLVVLNIALALVGAVFLFIGLSRSLRRR